MRFEPLLDGLGVVKPFQPPWIVSQSGLEVGILHVYLLYVYFFGVFQKHYWFLFSIGDGYSIGDGDFVMPGLYGRVLQTLAKGNFENGDQKPRYESWSLSVKKKRRP